MGGKIKKKKLGKKKFGAQIGPKFVFPVFQVEIPRSHVHNPNLKRNGWKLFYLGPTALFGTQNCPIPIGPFSDRNRKFAHCKILYIIMQQKPDKLQTSWTSGSIVMRPPNFVGPKRVSTQNGAKSVPYGIFECSRRRYLKIMCTYQIWSRTVENCSI